MWILNGSLQASELVVEGKLWYKARPCGGGRRDIIKDFSQSTTVKWKHAGKTKANEQALSPSLTLRWNLRMLQRELKMVIMWHCTFANLCQSQSKYCFSSSEIHFKHSSWSSEELRFGLAAFWEGWLWRIPMGNAVDLCLTCLDYFPFLLHSSAVCNWKLK